MLSTSGLAGAQTPEDIPKLTGLIPLPEYLAMPDEKTVDAYAFIRCSGLFLGYKYYAGANFDEATTAQSDQVIELFRNVAITLNTETAAERRGISTDEVTATEFEAIMKETWITINSVAFFVDDRMKANYASSGQAFGGDKLITGDFEICGQLMNG
jgi:hypothetical protein